MLPQEKHPWPVRLRGFWQLIRADKPIGIFLLLWPALWALWIAGEGSPDWYVTLVFVFGTVLMRSAGCAVNDYADRHVDGRVMRTCQRPIATGIVKPKEAVLIFAGLSLIAFLLVLTLNLSTILMSFVALALAAVYPFMKRYTHLPQLFLGMAFGWAVPMAFTALQNQVLPVTWVLFAATLLWALIYDTEYAMVDRDDDIKIGVKSTAILFGKLDRYIIGLLQLLMIFLLMLVGDLAGRSWFYFLAILATSGFFIRQQQLMMQHGKEGAFAAFLNNNCFGMAVFLILLVDYWITS
ncbi:MAG: 4-hydroxybenzoate octaprenyltransferase [Chromatiales bacterium]|jgi:4-hydroxybenzoate polyprenyltransferase